MDARLVVAAVVLACALPAGAAAQGSRCDTARQLMNNTRQRLQPGVTDGVLREATQNLRRATELCPGLGDAYYYLSLIAGALKDQARADNWRARADFHGSVALKNGEPLFLEGADPGATPAAATLRPVPPLPPAAGPPAVTVSPVVRRKLAVVAGISRFKDSRINALKYTSKDAEAVARTLKEDCDFDYVKLLLDEEATSYNLKTEIDRLARMADADDLVVIYVSSHGSPENLDTAGINYIVTHDTEVNNLYPTAYRMDDLLDDIGLRLKSERVVAFLDTCYSGGTFRELPPGWSGTASRSLMSQGSASVTLLQERLVRGSRNLVLDGDVASGLTGRVRQGVGRVIITSSSQAERSWEDDKIQHGYFTYYLLEALKRPSPVSLDDIFGSLRIKVPESVLQDKKQSQHPGIARSRERVNLYLKDKTRAGGRE